MRYCKFCNCLKMKPLQHQCKNASCRSLDKRRLTPRQIPEFDSLSKTFNLKSKGKEWFGGYISCLGIWTAPVGSRSCPVLLLRFIHAAELPCPLLHEGPSPSGCPISPGGRTRRLRVEPGSSKQSEGNLGREAKLKGTQLPPWMPFHTTQRLWRCFHSLTSHNLWGDRGWDEGLDQDQRFSSTGCCKGWLGFQTPN